MKKIYIFFLPILWFLTGCNKDTPMPETFDNPEVVLSIPADFPPINAGVILNKPTKYGVEMGKLLFNDKRLSFDNSISCASCHKQSNAFADHHPQAIGVEGRIALRNAPPIQNLAFMKRYNWDGMQLRLEKQVLVPIITHEEMNSSILDVIDKIEDDTMYKDLLRKGFGDENMTPDRIYDCIAQYEYTLISANSKYDSVTNNLGAVFTEKETDGFQVFQEKCASCHATGLFTDQTFRNVGFPLNPSPEEAGRARVTGNPEDFMAFRVPSLRNIEYTAPYGSFGQFATLMDVLNYFDNGVPDAPNLDPILKENGNRIPMTEKEKEDIIAFLKTLSDHEFVGIRSDK